MSSAERIKQRVKHLHERIERLQSSQPCTFAEYLADTRLSDAVERNSLVHFYMTVEPDKMYEYLQNDIPYLEQFEAFALGVLEG